MSEQEQIETILGSIERPSFVTEIRHILDNDWSGDPAVMIWVILRDDVAESAELLKRTEPIRTTVVQALRDAGLDRWPYVHVRGQSEQAELDRAEAA
ncbi:MAG: hypothetical protein GY842_22495 [bacterium]|nr:hypothetical protein [bacterium]